MDLFELNPKGEVIIKPEAREIPELKLIIERDKSKDKATLNKEIQYIWHLCNSKSPYEAYGESPQRETAIIADFIKLDKWSPDKDLLKLKEKYLSLLDSPSKRLLRASRKAVEEIALYLGDPDTDPETKAKLLEKVPKIVEGLDKCEEKVKKEISTNERIRGGGAAKTRER